MTDETCTMTISATAAGTAGAEAWTPTSRPRARAAGAGPAPASEPCAACELLGRRRLTCGSACCAPASFRPAGAVLVLAWLATLAAFVAAVV